MTELEEMRLRILRNRRRLAAVMRVELKSERFDFVERQRGMFSLLGLTIKQIDTLRQQYAIFMPGDGRLNVAGLVDRVAMDFNVLMSMGDTGVVEWCRKDAEAASTEYDNALAESPPPEIRSLLERQLGEIRKTVGGLEAVLREYGGPKS